MWWDYDDEDDHPTRRMVRHAYHQWSSQPSRNALGMGVLGVWGVATLEGYLQFPQLRFALRYGIYNILPSVIWGTQSPTNIIESSPSLLKSLSKHFRDNSTNDGLSRGRRLAPRPSAQHQLYITTLCSIRGAIAGSIVLGHVVALTTLWQEAQHEYRSQVRNGTEPPMIRSPTVIRLAGQRSPTTVLSLKRGDSVWPVVEGTTWNSKSVATERKSQYSSSNKITTDGEQDDDRPMYWQVKNGAYSQWSSWEGMSVNRQWLFDVLPPPPPFVSSSSSSSLSKSNLSTSTSTSMRQAAKLLYLEADATTGDESSLALITYGNDYNPRSYHQRLLEWFISRNPYPNPMEISKSKYYSSSYELDLDLKEVGQGFRRLAQAFGLSTTDANNNVTRTTAVPCNDRVVRVLLVDGSLPLFSGGGHPTSVRQRVEQLALADLVLDARTVVEAAILQWLSTQNSRVIRLETPSPIWFESLRAALQPHGYTIIDASSSSSSSSSSFAALPMLVYERSNADTRHTIQQYLEQGLVQDDKVCALLASHEEVDEGRQQEKDSHHTATRTIGHQICSCDLYDRLFRWVRTQVLEGRPVAEIQASLDSGAAVQEL